MLGFVVALLLAAIIGGFAYLIIDDTSRLSDARTQASTICGRAGAVTYDVSGQDELVYACNSDHVLRTMGY